MLRGRMRLAAEALLLGTALFHAGCAGTPVRFETPPGARVRIDGGASSTVPFERGVAPGVHEVEVEAPPAPGEEAGRPLRGLLVIFESAGGGGVHFGMDGAELARCMEYGDLLWTGTGSLSQEGGVLKAAVDGVDRDHPDVALALARDEERKAALEAATGIPAGDPAGALPGEEGPGFWVYAGRGAVTLVAAAVTVLLVAVVIVAVAWMIDPPELM